MGVPQRECKNIRDSEPTKHYSHLVHRILDENRADAKSLINELKNLKMESTQNKKLEQKVPDSESKTIENILRRFSEKII
jgi:hypothetical protein